MSEAILPRWSWAGAGGGPIGAGAPSCDDPVVSLEQIRADIDRLDADIVRLLAERQALVTAAAAHKSDERAVRAVDRQARVIERARANAARSGLAPDIAEAVYRAMIDGFVALELRAAGLDRPT